MSVAERILISYPDFQIPDEVYSAHNTIKTVETSIVNERDKLLQVLCLIEEYELTLKELSKIMDIADGLMVLPLNVLSLSHLQVRV